MPTSYRYPDAHRKNLPASGMAVREAEIEREKIVHAYDPHLTPVLRFDDTGNADQVTERIEALLKKAETKTLTPAETKELREALLRSRQPWLEWSGKREKATFQVDPVALHIHEKVSARAILKAAQRDDLDQDLFGQQALDREAEKQFYQHDVDWANRLILGDSLQVMSSLARREGLAGKVQMIYIDPPYGIKFSSNWQNEIGKREVKEQNDDHTREPEMIKAYRDTWTLGVHSYLDYLKQRLIVARELLTDSGSVFVQISDENLHRVRSIMDEVFGAENFVSLITCVKTSSQKTDLLSGVADFLLWYSRDVSAVKFNALFTDKTLGADGTTQYKHFQKPTGEVVTNRSEEAGNDDVVFAFDNLTSQSPRNDGQFPVDIEGRRIEISRGYWKTNPEGMKRLCNSERLKLLGNTVMYRRFLDDFPVNPISNVWRDVLMTGFSEDKLYVVQTSQKIITRCIQMTTTPGDLVLDPTSGSGTTAFIAEQWGRRWITIDSSRVAVAIARQRLLTARFETYKTKDASEGVDPDKPKNPGTGFHYRLVPHVGLRSIAQNKSLDPIFDKHEPILAEKLQGLKAALNQVASDLRRQLVRKLIAKHQEEGGRAVTDADQRRWLLPGTDPQLIQPIQGSKDVSAISLKQAEAYRAAIPANYAWQEWEVPFDTDTDWPQPLQDALTVYRQAWRAKMDEVNACIEANAEQEELVDQPEIVKGVARVTGPFTVESVRPLEKSLKGEPESPIGGAPEGLDTYDTGAFRVRETDEDEADDRDIAATNAASHLDRMLLLLARDGVTFPGNKHIAFDNGSLNTVDGEFIHAEGTFTPEGAAKPRTVGIVIGPEHGAVTAFQARTAISQAIQRRVDELVFAGFSFDSGAQDKIQESNDIDPIQVHMALIRPDVLMGDLLKGNKTKKKAATSQTSEQIFTVFGQPRTRLERKGDEYLIHMEGMDIYDPVKNRIVETRADKVAAWFVDSDYDGKTFCICQAFFPDKEAWTKLANALRTTKEEDLAELLESMSGGVSLSFPAGKHQRVAVKVIDPRGNEVLRVHPLV